MRTLTGLLYNNCDKKKKKVKKLFFLFCLPKLIPKRLSKPFSDIIKFIWLMHKFYIFLKNNDE